MRLYLIYKNEYPLHFFNALPEKKLDYNKIDVKEEAEMKNRIIVIVLLFFIVSEAFFVYIGETMTVFSLKSEEFVFEYGTEIPTDVENYVDCSSKIANAIQLNLKKVENKVGTYNASVTYLDKTYKFKIKIVDNKKPKVKLKKIVYNVALNERFYASSTILKVTDASVTNSYFLSGTDDDKLVKYKKYDETGTYIERVVVVDHSGNQSAPIRIKVNVVKNTIKPVLRGVNSITIALNSDFDPLSGVSAIDDTDGIITNKIDVQGHVDTKVKGTYTITYRVEDSSGNETVKLRKVIVQ